MLRLRTAAGALSFSRELAFRLGLTIALTGVVAAVSIYALRASIAASEDVVRHDVERLRLAERLRTLSERRVAQLRGYLFTGDRTFLDRLAETKSRFETLLARERILPSAAPGSVELMDAVSRRDDAYEEAIRDIVALRARGAPQDEIVRRYERAVYSRGQELEDTIAQLGALELQDFEEERRELRRITARDKLLMDATALGALLAGAVLAWLSNSALGRAHEEARTAAAAQGQLAAMRSAFEELKAISYAISHNLRAPARAADAYALRVLQDHGDDLGEEGRGRLLRIREASRAMGEIIDALLRLLRVASTEIAPRQLDLSALASQIAERLRARWPERRAEFVIPSGLEARGDPALIEVALEGLLENAFKFTARTADARIELGRSDGSYFVRDNGPGFDMALAGKLFKPFQRLHRRDEFEGLGIGLPVVERAIRAHGGRIWAESAPGRGAEFRFTLGDSA